MLYTVTSKIADGFGQFIFGVESAFYNLRRSGLWHLMIEVIRYENKMMHIMHRFVIHPGQLFDPNL